ncbi:hypothetical protein EOM60_03395 [Candidatus Saccharibacteria bacterium]|nr:hypothetical protein [Candidatus Saccharibacteria bacterium]
MDGLANRILLVGTDRALWPARVSSSTSTSTTQYRSIRQDASANVTQQSEITNLLFDSQRMSLALAGGSASTAKLILEIGESIEIHRSLVHKTSKSQEISSHVVEIS